MKNPPLYPLKFYPQLKEKVWGGAKLATQFGKEAKGKIGESWELSGVKGNISKAANGALKNKSLSFLIRQYQEALLGKKVYKTYGNEFPLLFKFLDAKEDLSVQLHPDDDVAKKRHNSLGKTEMWYIQQADENARLILGFNKPINKETYLKTLSEGNITQLLHSEKVQKGDAFFIAPGTVHAIGAGVMLAEIQQTSDITYRIYDWDRPDVDGSMRELHTDLALDVISFEETHAKLNYTAVANKTVLLCKSPYFETNMIKVSKKIKKNITSIDSFIVYMCVEGSATLANEALKLGETLLIPACFNEIEIEAEKATLLEVYIP